MSEETNVPERIRVEGRERVEFVLPGGAVVEASIRDGRLRVTADGGLSVSPAASNVVFISPAAPAEDEG